jgi:hypothetical protein
MAGDLGEYTPAGSLCSAKAQCVARAACNRTCKALAMATDEHGRIFEKMRALLLKASSKSEDG